MRPSRTQLRNRNAGGFTLVEVMLAMAAATMVAASITSVLFVTSHAPAGDDGIRSMVVQTRVATARMSSLARSAQMILDAGPDYVIFWTGDLDGDDQPSLSELCRVEWDAGLNELHAYRAPADLSDARDTLYSLATDFDSITEAIKGTAEFPVEVWARNLTEMAMDLNDNDPREASGFSARLTMESNGRHYSVIMSATIRSMR